MTLMSHKCPDVKNYCNITMKGSEASVLHVTVTVQVIFLGLNQNELIVTPQRLGDI